MSVLLDTSLGEIVIDLLVDDAPIACLNFLKLCKIKFYSQQIFHFIERDLLIQAGDPSRTGRGGSSIFGLLGGAKFFQDEIKKSVRHNKAGTVSMANSGPDSNSSQFFILARDGCDYLDGKAPPLPVPQPARNTCNAFLPVPRPARNTCNAFLPLLRPLLPRQAHRVRPRRRGP